ncbi:MAG: tyrosine-type recombinase/integrase [Endomicrobium sp.]|jgi:site-specific recombinase XerD|nr:tyrosine-type recombinase/integrase [Endomicrobium sp.]
MNLHNLIEKSHKLIEYMNDKGYSQEYIEKIEREIIKISKLRKAKIWTSYEDYLSGLVKNENLSSSIKYKKSIIGLIQDFEVYNKLPDKRHHYNEKSKSKYFSLIPEFKKIIDFYRSIELENNIKQNSSIETCCYNTASFLYDLQQKNITELSQITENVLLSIFQNDDGTLIRGPSCRKNIMSVFRVCIPLDPLTINNILSFFPLNRVKRKNIEYLTSEEVEKIKSILGDHNSNLSFRDIAIGSLALYTGLRASDIAGLRLSSIDWQNDVFFINQQKTGKLLELPLTAIIGNAIYNYLIFERLKIENEFVFLSPIGPHSNITSATIKHIANKIFKEANMS